MMADVSIEQQIIDSLRKLNEDQQRRVLEFVEHELSASQITLGEWLEKAASLRAKLRAMYGEGYFFNTQAILDEIREEASWPRQ